MKSIYVNSFQIHSNSQNIGYVVTGIEGVGFPGLRLSRYARSGENGAIVSNSLYDGRRITITGFVFSDSIVTYEQRRRALQEALGLVKDSNSVPTPITLKLQTMDDLLVQIDAYVEEFDVKVGELNGMEFLISFFCPDPAFLSQDEVTTSLATPIGGGAVYPVVYPVIYGGSSGGQESINNRGTMETYPVIYLNGPLTNPLIQNITVDRFVKLQLTLSSGEQAVINMRNKTILKNGNQSIISYKTDNSLFWWLEKGVNLVKLITSSSSDEGSVQIKHRNAYVGL